MILATGRQEKFSVHLLSTLWADYSAEVTLTRVPITGGVNADARLVRSEKPEDGCMSRPLGIGSLTTDDLS